MKKYRELTQDEKQNIRKIMSITSFLIGLFTISMSSMFQSTWFGYILGFILCILGAFLGILSLRKNWILSSLGTLLSCFFLIILWIGFSQTKFFHLEQEQDHVKTLFDKLDYEFPIHYELKYINTYNRVDASEKMIKYTIKFTDKGEIGTFSKYIDDSIFQIIESTKYEKMLPEGYKNIWTNSLYTCLYIEETNTYFEIPKEEGEYTIYLLQTDGKSNIVIYQFLYQVEGV